MIETWTRHCLRHRWAIMGRYNWWLPAGVARVFRVAPSPLVQHGK